MLARQEAARQEIRGDCQFPDSMGLPVSSIDIPWHLPRQERSLGRVDLNRKSGGTLHVQLGKEGSTRGTVT